MTNARSKEKTLRPQRAQRTQSLKQRRNLSPHSTSSPHPLMLLHQPRPPSPPPRLRHHPRGQFPPSAAPLRPRPHDRDEILLYLQAGLTGISPPDVPAVENYIIEHGNTRVPWAAEWKWFAPNQKNDADDGEE